jgi:hypothetical protein
MIWQHITDLRRKAKAVKKACDEGDIEAQRFVVAYRTSGSSTYQLMHCQHAVARAAGFDDWANYVHARALAKPGLG